VCVCVCVRMDSKEQLVTFLHCMLWGMILHFMAGYFFLHSWNNMFAELLRFADREFYSVRGLKINRIGRLLLAIKIRLPYLLNIIKAIIASCFN